MLFLVDTNGVPSVGVVRPPEPGAALRRHDAADRVAHRAGERGRPSAGRIDVTANATDNDAVAGVQFKLDGADLGAEDTIGAVLGLVEHDDGAQRRAHADRGRARPVGQRRRPRRPCRSRSRTPARRRASSPPTASTPAAARRPPTQSGNGNNGTLTNATWAGAAAGRFGNALSFNGTNASVTIPDSASLDLTTGMTLEAWVQPDRARQRRGGPCVLKEQPGYYAYGLYASTGHRHGPERQRDDRRRRPRGPRHAPRCR